MKGTKTLDGILFADLLRAGAANLNSHVQEINNLNVFPIPDGDTGDNMLLTILGGTDALKTPIKDLSTAARKAADGMLLGARGNSGVILSQLFNGIAKGFSGINEADLFTIGNALKSGTKCAYSAVMEPVEGTILTVFREAADYAIKIGPQSVEEMLSAFIEEARRTLEKTPEMLAVLKKAGVVDSGGAGIVYIAEGARSALEGETGNTQISFFTPQSQDLNLDLFTESSVLEFGYCTECLLRLQKSKTDPETFDINIITDYLKTIGNSVVSVKTGSIVKIHVHTMIPGDVLNFCQQYGEFLKIKVENMSLQHNNTVHTTDDVPQARVVPESHKTYGVVAVASGEGVKNAFIERGADRIVDGGQCMNPSAENFLDAFSKISADTIFVFPNNSNIILTAKQAAALYRDADVRVIESRTIGDGYAALSMFDTTSRNTDTIIAGINESMQGVVTAEVSTSIRDTSGDGPDVHAGDYIGFVGDDILSANTDRLVASYALIDSLNMSDYDIFIMFYGKNVSEEESRKVEEYVHKANPFTEVYSICGMQDIYDYIMVLE